VSFTRNVISLTGTFGSGVAAHAVQLRGHGPVSFVGNTLYGGNVGGSGTTPPTSGIFIQSRSGSTIMPASTAIYGSDNCIRNFHNGVSVFDSFANAYGGLHGSAYVAFVDDDITGNDTAGVANGASPTLDFSDNWWGCAAGPGNPGCDATIGAVDSNPALAAPTVCFVCSVDAHCDDGLFCTGVETCNAGFCQASGDPCTGGAACNDVCDEVADGCVAPDGSSCDDGDVCTIDDVCTAGACGGGPSCGDGVEQPGCGEACDDGNTTSNDGCSATCQDEFVCTPAPLAGCRTSEATKSQLQIKDREDLKDQVKWKWTRGAVTPKLDYGTPLTTTDYRLCIYANGALVSRTHIPAGGVCLTKPCWKETKVGYVYKDKEATPDGITGLTLKEGLVPGKAKISLKGKGVNVDTPDLPLALPVTVQLRAANGVCWESVHSAPAQKNDELLYKDKSD
jgi:cysteine-rich repeat protein